MYGKSGKDLLQICSGGKIRNIFPLSRDLDPLRALKKARTKILKYRIKKGVYSTLVQYLRGI